MQSHRSNLPPIAIWNIPLKYVKVTYRPRRWRAWDKHCRFYRRTCFCSFLDTQATFKGHMQIASSLLPECKVKDQAEVVAEFRLEDSEADKRLTDGLRALWSLKSNWSQAMSGYYWDICHSVVPYALEMDHKIYKTLSLHHFTRSHKDIW